VASAQAPRIFLASRHTPSRSRAQHQQLRAWWCPPATSPPWKGPPQTAASVVVPSRPTPSLAGPTTDSCDRGGALPTHPLPDRAHHNQLRPWWCSPATPPPWQGPPPTAVSAVVPHRVRLCLGRAGRERVSGPARVVLMMRPRHGGREREATATAWRLTMRSPRVGRAPRVILEKIHRPCV